jgi:hypothetical protein
MDRTEQLRHLPPAYAIALTLHDADVDEAQIAATLGIDQYCVAPLLEVGRAKAARIAMERGLVSETRGVRRPTARDGN